MASDLRGALSDANSFQEGLNAFDKAEFAKECPATTLIYKDIEDPDAGEVKEEPPPGFKSGKAAVGVTVRNLCTGETLAGASVFIGGKGYTSNADGYVYVGYLTAGQTYPILVTNTGYHDNTTDSLANDEIVVPEEPSD